MQGGTMNKYKLLKFGRGYINKEGNLMVCAVGGTGRSGWGTLVGYDWIARSSSRQLFVASMQTLSRIVPNDGNWTEIDEKTWDEASSLMSQGISVKLPEGYKPSGSPIFTIRKKTAITHANS